MTQQSEKPTQPSPEAEAVAQHRIEAALKGVTRSLNSKQAPPPRHHNEGLPHFVQLSRQLGEALIENAEQQVTRAANNLEEVKRWAENMKVEAQAKWEEMQDLERKFEDYRSYLLQANDRYNGEGK
jgi:hypothetical protein